MTEQLGKITPGRKSGEELFHLNGISLDFKLAEFWQWSVSDLITNTTRGILAEFIVAKALEVADGVRYDWDAYDIKFMDGSKMVKVEVKSTAFVQSWEQDRLPDNPGFVVRKSKPLDTEKGKYDGEAFRQADVYVFALLAEKNKNVVDPLNVNQWEFYVLPTLTLNNRARSQHSITLNSLKKLTSALEFKNLKAAVIAASKAK